MSKHRIISDATWTDPNGIVHRVAAHWSNDVWAWIVCRYDPSGGLKVSDSSTKPRAVTCFGCLA